MCFIALLPPGSPSRRGWRTGGQDLRKTRVSLIFYCFLCPWRHYAVFIESLCSWCLMASKYCYYKKRYATEQDSIITKISFCIREATDSSSSKGTSTLLRVSCFSSVSPGEYWDGVWICLWTAATSVPIVQPPDDIWTWRNMVEWYWQGRAEWLRDKSVLERLCPPQIPH
jgi:hypothetical protein